MGFAELGASWPDCNSNDGTAERFARKVLVVKSLLLAMMCCILAQDAAPLRTFHVYPTNHQPRPATTSAISSEQRVGNVLYQVYWRRGEPKKELFRVQVGWYVWQELVKTWNYGIETEGDFNGDGQPDYVWYGGDDTSESIVLFTSAVGGYKRTDLIKTAEAAWKQRFHKPTPDLAALDGEYGIATVVIERSAADLTLVLGVGKRLDASKQALEFLRVCQDDFKP